MKTVLSMTAIAVGLALGAVAAQAQTEPNAADANAKAAAAPNAAIKKGMTWGIYKPEPITGTATVSCQGAPASPKLPSGDCDPYQGDTLGTVRLPVLCFHKLNMPYPVPNTGISSGASHWSGGVIATTPAVSPIAMGWTTRSQVDGYCASQFGPGWVVAEHHMGQGQGWKFGAYGNVGTPGKQRFWVDVNNQPNGNVWH
jgi:hypothetical protein